MGSEMKHYVTVLGVYSLSLDSLAYIKVQVWLGMNGLDRLMEVD